jgi:hypothetical protein
MDAERLLGNLLGRTLSRTIGRRELPIFRGSSLTTKANLGIGLLGLATRQRIDRELASR